MNSGQPRKKTYLGIKNTPHLASIMPSTKKTSISHHSCCKHASHMNQNELWANKHLTSLMLKQTFQRSNKQTSHKRTHTHTHTHTRTHITHTHTQHHHHHHPTCCADSRQQEVTISSSAPSTLMYASVH